MFFDKRYLPDEGPSFDAMMVEIDRDMREVRQMDARVFASGTLAQWSAPIFRERGQDGKLVWC